MKSSFNSLKQGLFAIVLLAGSLSVSAQSGCPAINAGTPVQLPCGVNCTTLTATPFQVGATTSYSVNSIPYTPFSYSAGTAIVLAADDQWASVISLPFNFCFFGNVYNQAVVGANGIVTFNTYRAMLYNPWSLTACVPIPSTNPVDSSFTNSIMCPYQDIDPALGGTITYQIIGSAPCRILVVSYYEVPMFNTSDCPGNNCTCQMAIYETTNAIEIYIQNKQFCSVWNGGMAIEGIMDATGANGYFVAGRNLSQWNASNDAWRFTPNGPSIVNVSWYKGNSQISADSTVQVCPNATTTYTARAVYTPCAGGTPVTVSDSVTVSLTGSLNAGVDSTVNVSCYGLSNGKAYAHVNGGTAPVNYGWNNGSHSLTLTNLSAGTYVFTAADAGACVRVDTIVILQPNPVGITANLTNPACHGGCNGLVATIDTGGTGGPYTYHWNTSPVQTTQTAMGLCAGTFNVTATDGNGCTGSSSFTLTDPAPMFIYLVSRTNVTCRGESNGSVVVNAGGTFNGTVSFQWSNGEAGAADTALAIGVYKVTATDTAGCSATASYSITQPANGISITAPTITNDNCYGNTNGAIVAHASGGIGALTYNWTEVTNGALLTGATINHLAADTFNLTVTDASGCFDTARYVVTSPPPLIIDSTRLTGAYCGTASAYAQVYISGGTGSYSYSWSGHPSVTTSSINGLTGGIYIVTITDAGHCSIEDTIGIPQTSPIIITLVNQTNVSCFGNSDGLLSITLNGGTSPYNVMWSNGANDSLQISNLVAGTYVVHVTDVNGCNTVQPYTVTQPQALVLNNPVIQNIGCVLGSRGSITAQPSGGTQAYNYSWVEQSNNQAYNTQTISNLIADAYNLTVTDAHGCSTTATYNITAVLPLIYTIDSTNVSCFNGNNGSVSVAILSGTPPYQYFFDNTPGTDSNYNNLTAGLVDVIISDASNCRSEVVVNIQQPLQIIIHLNRQVNDLCNGGNNAVLAVSATGGTPGYVFTWSNQYIGAVDSALTAGNYSVTVSDTNTCTVTQSYQIMQPTPLVAAPVAQNALCNGAGDGSIDADPSGGTPGYGYLWSDGSATQVAHNLARGAYSCTITDANGCSVIATDTVGEPTRVIVTRDSAIAVKCVSQKNGSVIMAATGGYPPYTYSATQDHANFVYCTNGILVGLDTGIYSITIADSMGCTSQISVYVPPATLDSFTTSVDSTLCYGYNDGAALLTPLPPSSILNGPYKFGIDGEPASTLGQDTGYFQNLSPGLHIITAINTKGCTDSIPVFVPEPLPIVVTIIPDSIALPLGGSQAVQVICLNVTNPSYNWTPSTGMSCVDCPNPIVSAYGSGNYLITVSTINGVATCYGTATLHVRVSAHPRMFAPNAFTPNGDGYNDKFEIYGEDIKTISLKIFDRWGEMIFETTNSLAGWDGTYKGIVQNPGVYTYEAIITYLDNSQETKNGTITLIR